MRKLLLSILPLLAVAACTRVSSQTSLTLGENDYFERQGVNVLVFSNAFNGGFNDEKNSGIEIIHHGVRTVQGGAVRPGAVGPRPPVQPHGRPRDRHH